MNQRSAEGRETSPRYRGWRAVAACFAMAVFSWGFGFYGQGVLLARLHEQHGWPIAQISSATTAYYLASAVLIVFVGEAIDRFGARAVLIGGVLCVAAAVAAMGRIASPWQLYPVYGLLAAGWAATGVVAITTVIGGWFSERRGLAISLALNGASVGGVVGAPALAAATARYGLASALLYGGLLMAAILAPVIAWMVGDGPGSGRSQADTRPARAARSAALRSPAFWTISGPFAAALFVQVGFIVHQFSLVERAAGAGTASLAAGLTAVMAVAGRLGLGLVIDRIDQRLASAVSLASQAAAIAILASASGPVPLVAASCLFGLSVGNVITLPALIIHREFAAAAFATTVALSTAIGQFLYAFGPGLLGWLRDLSGGYGLPLSICVAVDLAAAAVVASGRARA